MISPELYYQKYLEGKTKEEILTAIRGLKQKMGYLKNIMERPNDELRIAISPDEMTQLGFTRQYLDRAKKAYTEAGGTYILSKSEKRMVDFNTNIFDIKKIRFSIGGYPDGYRNYVVELTDHVTAYTELREDKRAIKMFDFDRQKLFTNETFLVALKKLHIGEWRRSYSIQRFGYIILDGTQWELEIEYNNNHKTLNYYGNNSYPYNFNDFQRLFGIN